MSLYLDFDNQQKGYESFKLSTENIKANIGKQICYVTSRDVDRRRGYVFPRYNTIHSLKYRRLYIGDGSDYVPIGDILDCGIKKSVPKI